MPLLGRIFTTLILRISENVMSCPLNRSLRNGWDINSGCKKQIYAIFIGYLCSNIFKFLI